MVYVKVILKQLDVIYLNNISAAVLNISAKDNHSRADIQYNTQPQV